jgi:nicotinate-nucleotide--dimethylbenzimidazole phosphoribosyltransferase
MLEEQDAALLSKIDTELANKTMPLGALGQLQALAKQLALTQQNLFPSIQAAHLLLFAGDHGIAHEGVSAYPQEVTWQMVRNFLAGGAAVNCLARGNQLALRIIDAGVAHDFSDVKTPDMVHAKIALGTANFSKQEAMTPEQLQQCLRVGAQQVRALPKECNVVAFGEMGIANTSSAALLTSRITGFALADCVGRGTGLNDAQLKHKLSILERANALHATATTPEQYLAAFGGFEIAMMVGAMLQAQRQQLTVLVDGFITTAAVLVATAIEPRLKPLCVYSHQSAETGHRLALAYLDARPLLQLDLRLGEGSGAALALPLLRSACSIMSEMATFSSAQVDQANP